MENLNGFLELVGFGESNHSRFTGFSNTREFDVVAYAEAYEHILLDPSRATIDSLSLQNTLLELNAKGEASIDDIKDKVKEGVAKVKKILIELYDKAIRFFTETVAYWLSNEKKIGKQLPIYKAKLTKLNSLTLKNPDAEVSVKDYTIIKNTIDDIKDKKETNSESVDALKRYKGVMSEIDSLGKSANEDASSILDIANDGLTKLKEVTSQLNEAIKETQKSSKKTKTKDVKDDCIVSLTMLIEGLDDVRKYENMNSAALNKEIRKLTEEKRKLEKEFKDAKDKSEEGAKQYQKDRACITAKVKLTNGLKMFTDKVTGVFLSFGNMLVEDANKLGA